MWVLALTFAVFGLFLLFERAMARCGLDLIVYYEPATVSENRRLPSDGRDDPALAIRTVLTFDEVKFRSLTALMFHGDALATVDAAFLRDEYLRGTVIVGVNTPVQTMAGLLDPTLPDVVTVPDNLREPFFLVVTRNPEHCLNGLRAGCGDFVVEAHSFVGFPDLDKQVRAALEVRLRELRAEREAQAAVTSAPGS